MNSAKQNKEQEIIERLNAMYPTENDKALALMTMFGMCATFTMYLSDHIEIFKFSLPKEVQYAIAITSTNMCAFTAAEPDPEFKITRYKLLEKMDEQAEETLHRSIKHIIKTLHDHLECEDM